MITTTITSMSTKGQIVIPTSLRKRLRLMNGVKFFISTDGSNLLLKPVKEPSFKDFDKLMAASKAIAKKEKYKKTNLLKIIKADRLAHST